MKNHLRLVASNDDKAESDDGKPAGFYRDRFLSFFKSARPIFKYTLFVVLLFLRIPVNFLSRLLVFPLMLFFVFWGAVAGWTSPAALTLGGAAFACFLGGFAFDALVMKLAPEGYMMEL